MDWLWQGHILRGSQELLTGIPGNGKSQIHCAFVAYVTTGGAWPDGCNGAPAGNVIMLTAEDCLDQTIVVRASCSKPQTILPPPILCSGRAPIAAVFIDRWVELAGSNGPLLGCPLGADQPIPNTTGRRQDFESGQMVWSPDQGAGMVVSLYQVDGDKPEHDKLILDWGDSFPFSYDEFLVLVNGSQSSVKMTSGAITGMNLPVAPPPGQSISPDTPFTAQVEGCDTGLSTSCNQKWTIPVSWTFRNRPRPTPPQEFEIDFSGMTPTVDPIHVNDELRIRALQVAEYVACRKVLGDVFRDEEAFMEGAIAKLFLYSANLGACVKPDNPVRPLQFREEVNSALRFQQVKSNSGSSSTNSLCPRTGEYDVALTGYIKILYQFGSLLDNDVRNHIVNDLLNKRGAFDEGDLEYCSNPLGAIPETENHINQIESARYLTNQLLYAASGNSAYDNEANGMNNWMLAHLRQFLVKDFVEYNSKPYQTYTDNSIQNLFDFAKDRRVKMAAHLVLDYIAAKYAVSSNSLRRNAPYRRRPSQYSPLLLDAKADAQNARFTLLTGMTGINRQAPVENQLSRGYSEDINMLAGSSYKVPAAVLDLLMTPQHRNFYQRIHHDGVEIYASRPDYLITAGGYWMGSPYTFLGKGEADDEGVTVSTTLMPTDDVVKVDDMIRFAGWGGEGLINESNDADAKSARNRIETCVAPDFACGLNPIVPDHYKLISGCFVQLDSACANQSSSGPWTFIDYASSTCNPRLFGGDSTRPYTPNPRGPRTSPGVFLKLTRVIQTFRSINSKKAYVIGIAIDHFRLRQETVTH
jgi:hypothetical protein